MLRVGEASQVRRARLCTRKRIRKIVSNSRSSAVFWVVLGNWQLIARPTTFPGGDALPLISATSQRGFRLGILEVSEKSAVETHIS